MAQAGGRTLLIDTDMRRPRLHKSFGVANETGVSTAILGEITLEQAVRSSGVPNLDVLPCGPTPPNPAELLHTERFGALLGEALERYERVILDSPPTSAVTDAAVLGHRCDGLLLVLRGGHTTRESAAHARRQLGAANTRLLGVVINQVDFRNRYYGAYYYRYYRNYGYGSATKA